MGWTITKCANDSCNKRFKYYFKINKFIKMREVDMTKTPNYPCCTKECFKEYWAQVKERDAKKKLVLNSIGDVKEVRE